MKFKPTDLDFSACLIFLLLSCILMHLTYRKNSNTP